MFYFTPLYRLYRPTRSAIFWLSSPCDASRTIQALLTNPDGRERLFEKTDNMLFMASDKTGIVSIVGGVTILLKSKNKYGTIKEKREKNEMATTVVKCPYCGSEEVSLYGKSSTGAQRYLCRNKACSHKTFQLEYKNNASKPGTKEKIFDMTMNGAGTRDTGRVLRISPNTVTGVLKKRKNLQNQ